MNISAAQVHHEIEVLERQQTESLADELRLWEWGRWCGKELVELGYPPCLIRFSAKGSWEKDLSRLPSKIDDDEGLRIDAAVAKLPFSHRKVVITVYKLRVPSRELPKMLGWSAHQILCYQREALGMLWAWMCSDTKSA